MSASQKNYALEISKFSPGRSDDLQSFLICFGVKSRGHDLIEKSPKDIKGHNTVAQLVHHLFVRVHGHQRGFGVVSCFDTQRSLHTQNSP